MSRESRILGQRLRLYPAVILALVIGCTVRWISTYDETTDRAVTELQHKTSALLDSLDVPSPPSYQATANQYKSIYADLQTITLRNEARPKNDLTVKQLQLLNDNLHILEDLHKAPDFKQALVAPARSSIDATFRAILTLELAKRET